MTYNEALSYLERIKDTAIGAPVKGRFIESLFIGPTDWEQMTDFMNLRIQKGEETALTEFDGAGKSLSVYGVSVNNKFDVPHWDMTIMDTLLENIACKPLVAGLHMRPSNQCTPAIIAKQNIAISTSVLQIL